MHFALTQMTRHNIKLDQLTVRAVLLGASFLGDVSLARTILDLSYQHGMRCDAHAYTSAISSCARSNPPDPNAARELILQAASRGTTWTSAMINAAISSHGDNFSGAINMWKQLRLQTPANSRNVFAERVVYDALMRVCGRAARPDVALRVFYAAKKSEHLIPNSSSSRFVFNAFRRGVREANLQHAIDGNPLKKQYERHLRTECGATDDTEFAIERIRIKL